MSIRPTGETMMTVTESKDLKKGTRVYWRGGIADTGTITETSWDAVTIAWDNGQVASVHHGDMREIQRTPARSNTA
jgi:preprotein translocase subunit YajC